MSSTSARFLHKHFPLGYSRICLSLALVALLSTAARANIMASAQGTMTVDGQSIPIPLSFDSSTGNWGVGSLDSKTGEFSGFQMTTSEFDVTINGQMVPDPQISYGISVQDIGAPSTFGFFFSSPIVFPGGPNSVNSSIAGALNDFTGNGVSITPTLGPNIQIAGLAAPSTNMGVDVGPLNAHGLGPAGAFYTYGAYTAGPQPGPIGAWTSMSLTLGFMLSGGGDIAVLTGFAQIVPEPSSVVLALIGGVGLLWHVRRRRK